MKQGFIASNPCFSSPCSGAPDNGGMSITRVPPAPSGRLTGDARRWAAAKSEYLAGAEAEAVCRRHDIRTAYFLRLAGEQGWRRPDPATPSPDPAPAAQKEPLVIPETPQASSGTPQPSGLTAAQMADKAWAMLSAAVAAGRLIEVRGWLRLYKDLKPIVREEAEAERRARMDRDAAALRAAEQAPDEAVAPPLHCFSPPECNDASPVAASSDSDDVALQLHRFSPPECNKPSSTPAVTAPPDTLPGKALSDRTQDGCDDHLASPSHCFLRRESNNAGPDP